MEVMHFRGQYYVYHFDSEGHYLTGLDESPRVQYDALIWGRQVYYELPK